MQLYCVELYIQLLLHTEHKCINISLTPIVQCISHNMKLWKLGCCVAVSRTFECDNYNTILVYTTRATVVIGVQLYLQLLQNYIILICQITLL